MNEHADHGKWITVGRCVCCPCGQRLYQGKTPKTEEEQREMAEAFAAINKAVQERLS